VVDIREAEPGDWFRIHPFFAAVMAAGRTYAYPDDLSLEDARPWWMEEPPGRTVVATAGGAVVGSAKMGPNRPGRGAHVATASFLVDPDHQGRGVGRALGEHVIAWARASGFRSIQFNAVVETNAPAVHLWRSLGFEVLATVPDAFDHPVHGHVGLHLMFRRV
jgi:GNAT superfamily N-acetyltransferase